MVTFGGGFSLAYLPTEKYSSKTAALGVVTSPNRIHSSDETE